MHLFKYRWTASVCAILGAAVLALTPAAAAYGAPLPRTAEAYGVMLRRPVWPYDTGVLSESGIVMDLDSGAVLYGQRIHMQEAPASITKLLTALVVLENAALDEQVVFSHDAVYNVEGREMSSRWRTASICCCWHPLTSPPTPLQSMWREAGTDSST